jgi:hypothetical protein
MSIVTTGRARIYYYEIVSRAIIVINPFLPSPDNNDVDPPQPAAALKIES